MHVIFTFVQASAEKNNKGLQAQLQQNSKRLTELNLELSDADANNRKSAAENGELLRQLEEVDGEQRRSCQRLELTSFT